MCTWMCNWMGLVLPMESPLKRQLLLSEASALPNIATGSFLLRGKLHITEFHWSRVLLCKCICAALV